MKLFRKKNPALSYGRLGQIDTEIGKRDERSRFVLEMRNKYPSVSKRELCRIIERDYNTKISEGVLGSILNDRESAAERERLLQEKNSAHEIVRKACHFNSKKGGFYADPQKLQTLTHTSRSNLESIMNTNNNENMVDLENFVFDNFMEYYDNNIKDFRYCDMAKNSGFDFKAIAYIIKKFQLALVAPRIQSAAQELGIAESEVCKIYRNLMDPNNKTNGEIDPLGVAKKLEKNFDLVCKIYKITYIPPTK